MYGRPRRERAESCEGGERGGEAGPERSAAGPLALPRRKEGWGGRWALGGEGRRGGAGRGRLRGGRAEFLHALLTAGNRRRFSGDLRA